MDILERYKMVEFYNSLQDQNTLVSGTPTSNRFKSNSGARMDWEIKSRMDEILHLEDKLPE
jgi:hypothetical protein